VTLRNETAQVGSGPKDIAAQRSAWIGIPGQHLFDPQIRLLQRSQSLAWLEPYPPFSASGNCRASTRVAANAKLVWAHAEDPESSEFDALATAQCSLYAFKYGFDRAFGPGARIFGLRGLSSQMRRWLIDQGVGCESISVIW